MYDLINWIELILFYFMLVCIDIMLLPTFVCVYVWLNVVSLVLCVFYSPHLAHSPYGVHGFHSIFGTYGHHSRIPRDTTVLFVCVFVFHLLFVFFFGFLISNNFHFMSFVFFYHRPEKGKETQQEKRNEMKV